MWPRYGQEGEAEEGEPDWMKSEKEAFQKYHDKDGNGKLDKREIGDWIAPQVGTSLGWNDHRAFIIGESHIVLISIVMSLVCVLFSL